MPQKNPQKTAKKDNLPVTKVDVDLQNGGTISYANEVIATIAGVAANEIEGIAGMCVSGGFSDILGRNRNITRGVKVEVGSQEAAVDLYIIVEYGYPIQKVSAEVQENVRRALESLTGLRVVRVDVHVQGVSFEKEKKQTQNILEATKNPVLAEPETPASAPTPETPKEEPKPQEAEAPKEAQDEPVKEDAEFDSDVLTEEASLEADPAEADQAAQETPAEAPAQEEPPKAKTRKKTQPGKETKPDSSPKRPHGRVRA